jgi:hypothetical protein
MYYIPAVMQGVAVDTEGLKWQTPFRWGKPEILTNGTSSVGQWLANPGPIIG